MSTKQPAAKAAVTKSKPAKVKAAKPAKVKAAKPAKVKAAKPPREASSGPATPPELAYGAVDREASAKVVGARLAATLPTPRVELDFVSAWHLVIATILSAQSTDKGVNKVTPVLFERWPTPAALAAASQEDVEVVVKSTGFFRNKARAIREASRVVVERFGGEVPRTMAEILELPGVARKTGNVVLGSAYRIASGIVVDTHAGRVARRLGLTRAEDPVKVEEELMVLFPEEEWIDAGHRFVLHGRYVCLARAPRCAACPLNEACPSREAPPEGALEARSAAERRLVESRGEAR